MYFFALLFIFVFVFEFFFCVIWLGGRRAGAGMEAGEDEDFYSQGGDERLTKYPYGYEGGDGGGFFK